jgi:hypothetical protein
VRISSDDLQGFEGHARPLPPPVKPLIGLVEEVVLLSLGASRVRAHHVARIAASAHPGGAGDLHAAVAALEDRKMLTHEGVLRTLVPTAAAKVPARLARVAAIVRCPEPPTGEDAELLVLLAAARALEVEHPDDHMRAHARIASIGEKSAIPPAVAALAEELGTPTMTELADRLLKALREDFKDADFAGRSNISAALTYGIGGWQ